MKVGDRVKWNEAGLSRGPAGAGMAAHRYAESLRGTVTDLDSYPGDRKRGLLDVRWDGCSRAERTHVDLIEVVPKSNPRKRNPAKLIAWEPTRGKWTIGHAPGGKYEIEKNSVRGSTYFTVTFNGVPLNHCAKGTLGLTKAAAEQDAQRGNSRANPSLSDYARAGARRVASGVAAGAAAAQHAAQQARAAAEAEVSSRRCDEPTPAQALKVLARAIGMKANPRDRVIRKTSSAEEFKRHLHSWPSSKAGQVRSKRNPAEHGKSALAPVYVETAKGTGDLVAADLRSAGIDAGVYRYAPGTDKPIVRAYGSKLHISEVLTRKSWKSAKFRGP